MPQGIILGLILITFTATPNNVHRYRKEKGLKKVTNNISSVKILLEYFVQPLFDV